MNIQLAQHFVSNINVHNLMLFKCSFVLIHTGRSIFFLICSTIIYIKKSHKICIGLLYALYNKEHTQPTPH